MIGCGEGIALPASLSSRDHAGACAGTGHSASRARSGRTNPNRPPAVRPETTTDAAQTERGYREPNPSHSRCSNSPVCWQSRHDFDGLGHHAVGELCAPTLAGHRTLNWHEMPRLEPLLPHSRASSPPDILIASLSHRRARFPALWLGPMGKSSRPKPSHRGFFPARMRAPRGRFAPKNHVAPVLRWRCGRPRVRVLEPCHARSAIAGKSVPAMRKGDETCLQSDT
jgi:hypothetical protein